MVKSNILLTRKETAEMLGISFPTLRDYTKRGIIKGYTLGSCIRYKEHEVIEALQIIPNVKNYSK